MEQVSEYFNLLSTEAKVRFEEKVAQVGLKTDPYVMPSDLWVEEPPSLPHVTWSNMFLYDIHTQSKEAITTICLVTRLTSSIAITCTTCKMMSVNNHVEQYAYMYLPSFELSLLTKLSVESKILSLSNG